MIRTKEASKLLPIKELPEHRSATSTRAAENAITVRSAHSVSNETE
jgi:hypothetical protein